MKRGLKSYGLLLGLVFFLVPTLSAGSLLYFFIKDEVETRRLVTYMNFEQLAQRFQNSFENLAQFEKDGEEIRFARAPAAILDDTYKAVSGLLPDGLQTKGLRPGSCDMQNVGNVPYILCPVLLPRSTFNQQAINSGLHWAVWRLDESDFRLLSQITPHRAFLVSRRNQVVFQSDNPVPQPALLKKALVQSFIKSPLSKEATAPYTDKGAKLIGFAMMLPRSNLALFVESPASLVFAALWQPVSVAIGLLIIGLGFLFFLWKLLIGSLQDQILVLANSLLEFAGGFQVPTQHTAKDFLSDLGPMVDALNVGTLQVRNQFDEKTKGTPAPEGEGQPT